MAGKDFLGRGRDFIDDVWHAIGQVQDDIAKVQNIKQPTMPIYPRFNSPNPGDLPDDPVEGQFAIDGETNTAYFYSNGAWHKIGAAEKEWLIVDGKYYAPGSANPPYQYDFPPDATAPTNQFQLKMVGSDDDVQGSGIRFLLESDNQKYVLDDDGAITLPDGLWYYWSYLGITTASTVSSSSLAELNTASAIGGVGNIMSGTWRKNLPDINNVGGFHNWFLSVNGFVRISESKFYFVSHCDTAIRGAASITAEFTASFLKIADGFPTIVI